MVGIALPLGYQYYRLAQARGDYNVEQNPARAVELRIRTDIHTSELLKVLVLGWLALAIAVWEAVHFLYP